MSTSPTVLGVISPSACRLPLAEAMLVAVFSASMMVSKPSKRSMVVLPSALRLAVNRASARFSVALRAISRHSVLTIASLSRCTLSGSL